MKSCPAAAASAQGGTLRLGPRVKSLENPATYSWGGYDSNVTCQVCEYPTLTDRNNVTYPCRLEKWEARADLKTWTLSVRRNIKWHEYSDSMKLDSLRGGHVITQGTSPSVVIARNAARLQRAA